MSSLWLSIEPRQTEVRLMLSRQRAGTLLKARLPVFTADPRALALLLESLVAWVGEPLCAVVDADAEDVRRRQEHWARFLGDLASPQVTVEWVSVPRPSWRRDRFLGSLGEFRSARRLVSFAATGQR